MRTTIRSTLCCIWLVCLCTVHTTLLQRIRRQSRPVNHDDLPYSGWYGSGQNPSGGSPGAYYGTGYNPNYGSFNSQQNNAPSHGINAVSYGSNSNPGYHYNQQQQNYWNNNHNNNRWTGSGMNNDYNRPYNRYPPGSQGWYATGGNHWYQNGQTQISTSCFLLIGMLIFLIAT